MKHIFFNYPGEVTQASKWMYGVIGIIQKPQERYSENRGGKYFECLTFGISIIIETNFYDYDDEYRYMLTIKQDALSKVSGVNRESERTLAGIIISILTASLKEKWAYEDNDRLIVVG